MYVCMYVCMSKFMCVCMYVCVCVYVCQNTYSVEMKITHAPAETAALATATDVCVCVRAYVEILNALN
jgi:hypothetical protein